eukprot:246301-Prorocentrum_minimum.AAC.1
MRGMCPSIKQLKHARCCYGYLPLPPKVAVSRLLEDARHVSMKYEPTEACSLLLWLPPAAGAARARSAPLLSVPGPHSHARPPRAPHTAAAADPQWRACPPGHITNTVVTLFYGSSCANNGKGALNTPEM